MKRREAERGVVESEEGPARRAEAALQIALAGYFAAEQLSAQSLAYFYGSTLPTTVLWIHAWRPLPDLLTWFAALGWGMCVFLAVALAVVAAKRRAQAEAAMPDAGGDARLHLASTDGQRVTSMLLFGLAVMASTLLWIHGLAPRLLGEYSVVAASRAWIILVVGAALNRFLERW